MLLHPKRLRSCWPEVNNGFTFRDYIKSKNAGATIIQFYSSNHPASGSLAEWEARITGDQIAVNGVTVRDANYTLRVGDVVSYTRLPWCEPESPSHVDVLYEDEHMVALSKPSGLQVLPAAMFHQRTVLSLLQHHYGLQHAEAAGGTTAAAMLAASNTKDTASVAAVIAAGESIQGAAPESVASAVGMTSTGKYTAISEAPTTAATAEPGQCQRKPRGQQRQGKQEGSCFGSGRAPGAKLLGVPAPVHRLGRGTSGLLLCARTLEARRRLTEMMTDKTAAAAASVAAPAVAATTTRATLPVPTADAAPVTVALITSQASGHGNQQQPQAGGYRSSSSLSSSGDEGVPIRKLYRALVQGLVKGEQGRVDVPIGPILHPGVEGGLFAACPHGKPAVSIWKVLERRKAAEGCAAGGGAEAAEAGSVAVEEANAVALARGVAEDRRALGETLMQVEILTGRPHQIRIHMAALGHPLVGDPLYGIGGTPQVSLDVTALLAAAKRGGSTIAGSYDPHDGGFGRPGDCGYHLHSLELQLPHPSTGRLVRLRAPPPEILMTADERVKAGASGGYIGDREMEKGC